MYVVHNSYNNFYIHRNSLYRIFWSKNSIPFYIH